MQQRRPAPPHAQMTQPIRLRPANPKAAPRRAPATLNVRATTALPPRPVPQPPVPRPAAQPPRLAKRPFPARRTGSNWLILAPALGILVFLAASVAAGLLGMAMLYAGGNILPGVRSGGMALGGKSQAQAAAAIAASWDKITLQDGQHAWKFPAVDFGITVDAQATAKAAANAGRSNLFDAPAAIFGTDVPPVIHVDVDAARAALENVASQVEQPAVNAGVRFANGRVEPTAARQGWGLNVEATVNSLKDDPGKALADGTLRLIMRPVQPAITDAGPMVAAAQQLLTSPMNIRAYDPATGDSVNWIAQPEEWANWLTPLPVSNTSGSLSLTADADAVRGYLETRGGVFDSTRYLKMDEAVSAVQKAVSDGRTDPWIRVYHHDSQHTVRPGETITTIAWDYGVPYLYIQQANGGIQNVSIGQVITIPSVDNFLPYPVIPDKRIVVSISQQHAWVYENGAVKWDWVVSTGISGSPTWPGVYQIISHVPNAYAGNWNLWMPNFMGVYKPIPGADFTNGFHGFPTRGTSQLLWTNDLGTRVTYGCILLSNENSQLLYNWAQEGVVVEIKA
jgi:lipoprotein-anchoring transpeptidase ErfK/SrfK